jgi:hypothetical protein
LERGQGGKVKKMLLHPEILRSSFCGSDKAEGLPPE